MEIELGTLVKVTQAWEFKDGTRIRVGVLLRKGERKFTIMTEDGKMSFPNDTKIEVIR